MYNNNLLNRKERLIGDFSIEAKLIWHPSHGLYYENPVNGFCFFVKDFELVKKPFRTFLKLFADSRYMAYANGKYMARGPARSDPRLQYYDTLDLTGELGEGQNTIGILAVHFGYGTGQSIPVFQCICGEIVFVYDGGKTESLITDNTWKCLNADCYYPNAPRINGRQCSVEIFDAGKYPYGWNVPGYDHGKWADAVIVRPRDNDPFYNIRPRIIPMLEESIVKCRGTAATGKIAGEKKSSPISCKELITKNLVDSLVRDINNLKYTCMKEQQLPIVIDSASGPAGALLIKFDKVYSGYLMLEVTGSGGTVIDAVYSEYLINNKPFISKNNLAADRFILKNGFNALETAFGWKAFNHVVLIIRGKAKIEKAAIRYRRYPFQQSGSFNCDDPALNRIYEISQHTLNLCMQDGFLDSCSREQQQWIGDGRWQAITAWCLGSDARLQCNLLEQIGQSQDWTGMVRPRHPDAHNNISPIPSFALHWVSAFNDYVLYTGDISPVSEWWLNLVKCMRWFTAYETDHGLLKNVPYWSFIDWGSNSLTMDTNRGGIICALNLIYLEALLSMEKMAVYIKDSELSEYYCQKAGELKKSIIEAFWDSKNKIFADVLLEGGFGTTASEAANAMALLFLFDKNDCRAKRIAEQIIENIFIKETAGKYVLVFSSPFLQTYTSRALKKFNHEKIICDLVKKNYKKILEAGTSTTWERWDIENHFPGGGMVLHSASHGWGAQPIIMFTENILGVTPAKEGFRLFEFKPCLAGLKNAEGAVPVPKGKIEVRLAQKNGYVLADIMAPENIEFIYNRRKYSGGKHRFKIIQDNKNE